MDAGDQERKVQILRWLIICNVEYIESTPFFAAILYDQEGQRLDELILPFESYELALLTVRELADRNGVESFELWTSDNRLYVLSLQTAGIAGVIKHASDTTDTSQMVKHNSEILKELYKLTLKPPLPKWRAFLVSILSKLIKQVEGDGRYEV